LDWERFGAAVATPLATLPPHERARAVVLTPHWAYASVIEYYGRDRDVAPVVAPHNAYYFWRQEAVGRDIAVSVAIPTTALSRYFAETTQIGMYHCVYCARLRSDMPVYVSRGPVRPIVELLDEWRHFSIEAAPALSR
jgi:hypothetical protein